MSINEYRRPSDEDLAGALTDSRKIQVTGGPIAITIADLAAEIIGNRRTLRRESRAAEQIKKLRWMAEALVSKVEELRKTESDEQLTAEKIALWLEGHGLDPVDAKTAANAIRDGRWR